jgi:hypothetical protein
MQSLWTAALHGAGTAEAAGFTPKQAARFKDLL